MDGPFRKAPAEIRGRFLHRANWSWKPFNCEAETSARRGKEARLDGRGVLGPDLSVFARVVLEARDAHSLWVGMEEEMTFGVADFAKGFVAVLVTQDRTSVQPKDPEQQKAMQRLYDYLSTAAEEIREAGDREWLKQLVRLRNGVAPGSTGGFDQFETALRDLQLSFTESPNPYYEDIVFTVSKPFAVSALESFEPRQRQLVEKAAELFLLDGDRPI